MFEKKKKKIEGVEKEAKMSVLEGLRDMASSAMGDKLKGLKKVTVASDSPEGLKKGLEKAEELVEGKTSMMDMAKGHMESCDDESPEEESAESPEMEASEDESSESPSTDFESMSEDELDAALKKLMELKKQKSQE